MNQSLILAMSAINFYLVELPTVKSQVDEQSDDIFLCQVMKFYPNLSLNVTLLRYAKLSDTWSSIINRTITESE